MRTPGLQYPPLLSCRGLDRRNRLAVRENGRGALPRAVPCGRQGRFHGARPGSGVGCKKGYHSTRREDPGGNSEIREVRGALFQEGGHALLLIVGGEGEAKVGCLQAQTAGKVCIHAALDAGLGQGDGVAALAEDAANVQRHVRWMWMCVRHRITPSAYAAVPA